VEKGNREPDCQGRKTELELFLQDFRVIHNTFSLRLFSTAPGHAGAPEKGKPET
jgi:hypothetical protein